MSISDKKMKKQFTVSVRNLRTSDSGWYKCGIEMQPPYKDVTYPVHLTVRGAEGHLSGPETMKGLVGTSVTVECPYDKRYGQAEKFWCKTFGSTCYPLVSTDKSQKHTRMSIKDDRSGRKITVTMRSLMKNDAGWYHCGIKALNFDETHPVYLTVTGAVQSLVGPKRVTGKIGSSVSIVCLYSDDYRDHKKYWCKETLFSCSTLVTTNHNSEKERKSISDNKSSKEFTVIMNELKKEDEGLYQCGIERTLLSDRSFRDETTSVYVQVKGPEDVLSAPEEVMGQEGATVTIVCSYNELSKSNVKYWCKRGSETCNTLVRSDELQSKQRLTLHDNTARQEFRVTMTGLEADDEGWYKCGIKRTIFDDTIPVYVTVKDMKKFFSGPQEVIGSLNQSVTVVCCYGQAYKSYVKYWCKGNFSLCHVLVNTTGLCEDQRITISDNISAGEFTVVISHLKKEDEGWYQCGAQHGTDSSARDSVYLTIKDGSESLYGPSLVTGVIQEFVIIKCHYSLQYTWNKKFWCNFSDLYAYVTLVKTDETKSHDRISITDDQTQRAFTVTMTGLREDDKGQYYCAIETGEDSAEYFGVYLQVNQGKFTMTPTQTSRSSEKFQTTTSAIPSTRIETQMIIRGVASGALILLSSLAILIVYIKVGKTPKTQNKERNEMIIQDVQESHL
ncbi:polymeric immunoglobulin receptor-like isoform X2 [Erpetoichthys calabaricus]|uniref:polymeric immunoglobulin receptor-like isoform X2 n=1 Tax=Erpetoichthys calabaricus TaxID=27687 RepID=UPI00223498F6|nr:polymeric immunoglobulin receptor-like isoform X2 [Erpetoichthys calabaricus]